MGLPSKILFLDIQKYLNLHRTSRIKLKVFVFSNKSEIQKIYRDNIYNSKSDVLAFYDPKPNCIYVYYKDFNKGVMAHEFAHAIISANFVDIDVETNEMIAREVEIIFGDN